MNLLTISLIVLGASILLSFFTGIITKNYSTVDRLWSVLPVVYILIWMPEYIHNTRYLITSIIVILWGVRLTTNFAIKGGFKFSPRQGFITEDYRWEYVRKKITHPVLFELFNFFFISSYQLMLIYLFTLPLYFYGRFEGGIRRVEYILYFIHLILLITETIADIQQLRFFKRRKSAPWSGQKRYKLGFNTFGLWKYSRHPNYVCEMGQWAVVSLYLITLSGNLHWSGTGALLLILLFAGSTAFAESITLSKYPDYKEWQGLTSVWIPLKKFLSKFNQRRIFLSDDKELHE